MKTNNPIINETALPQGHESHPRRRATKLLDHAKHRARRDGLECRLTREWVLRELERGTCAATGIPFEFKGGYGSKVMNRHAPTGACSNGVGKLTEMGSLVLCCWVM
jgi:hypothetical protein